MAVSGELYAPAVAPIIRCVGGWMSSRTGLDAMEKRKFLAYIWSRTQSFSRPALVAMPTELSWIRFSKFCI
jgi:hypothetical protein